MDSLPQHYRSTLLRFEQISKGFVRFNLLFLALSAVEVVLFVFFLPTLSDTSGLAIALAAMFLTVFAYPLLSFYYQAKKPEQLTALLDQFVNSCKTSLGLSALSTAETLVKLAHYMAEVEWRRAFSLGGFAPLDRLVKQIAAYCYGPDVFRFKQMLLHAAVEEHLQQIRQTPTDLEAHASLANVYVALSQLYKKPPVAKQAPLFEQRFKTAARLAIEEFQILSQYAPNDPWIHEQLATGYRELGLYADQIRETEALAKLRPQDREVLFGLGALYFQQGFNAKGLRVYDELKKARFGKAEELLASYGKTEASEHHLAPIQL